MANKSYQTDTREDAYKTWRECGQNIERTMRSLSKKGYFITKPTLYAWIEKYNWKDRAARAEAEEQKGKEAMENHDAKAITSLDAVRERYEKYFATLGDNVVDNQAMFAYTGIIKSISEIKVKTGAYKSTLFLGFMRDLIDWLIKNDPDSVGVIEKNFDDFIQFAKEKYAA